MNPYRYGNPSAPDAGRPREVGFAPSLAAAKPFDLITLDEKGNVAPPKLAWRLSPSALAIVNVVLAIATLVLLGITFAGDIRVNTPVRVFCAFALFSCAVSSVNLRYLRGIRFFAEGRDDEAEKAMRKQLGSRVLGAAYQLSALVMLGRIESRRARHEEALDSFRRVRYASVVRRIDRRARVKDQALCLEVLTLCNLQRDEEARTLLATFASTGGDLVDLQTRIAALYLGVCTNTPAGEKDLAEAVALGSRLASGYGLLALAAWHHARLGDEGRARSLLLAEAKLPHASELDVALPRLAGWIRERQ